MTDALTGLGNQRALARALEDMLPRADDGRPLVLVLFDLDGFKHYNDTFGHQRNPKLFTDFEGLAELAESTGPPARPERRGGRADIKHRPGDRLPARIGQPPRGGPHGPIWDRSESRCRRRP